MPTHRCTCCSDCNCSAERKRRERLDELKWRLEQAQGKLARATEHGNAGSVKYWNEKIQQIKSEINLIFRAD